MIYYLSIGILVGFVLFIRNFPKIFGSHRYFFMMASVFDCWGHVAGIFWGYFCILLALVIYLVLGAVSWPYILWRYYATRNSKA